MTRRVEEVLRDALAEWAASVPAERDPYAVTVRGLRQARRRRWAATAVALCLIAAVAVPIAVLRPFRDVPLEGWEVRGSLADNQAFLDAARKEVIQEIEQESGDERVEYSRVVYADEREQRRWAAVAVTVARPDSRAPEQGSQEAQESQEPQESQETEKISWLWLLSGASRGNGFHLDSITRAFLAGGSLELPEGYVPETPALAWVRESAGGGARLFVLAPPGAERIAYSARPTFHPDGTWDRAWRQVPAEDGVAYGKLPRPREAADLVRLRVDGENVFAHVQRSFDAYSDAIHPEPGDAASGIPPQVALNAKGRLHRATGLPPNAFSLRMLWQGGAEEWLVAATRPDGVTFQVLSTTQVNPQVVLVPRGQASRPVAAVGRSWQGLDADQPRLRVSVVAPDVARGHVQLWRGGDKVAGRRLDGEKHVAFRSQEVVDAVRADDVQLTFRVFDQRGKEVYRGPVRDAWQAPWNR